MSTMESCWIDKLDVPPCDFADPNFNPYAYDNADEWFDGRRETTMPEHIQQFTKNSEPMPEATFVVTSTETLALLENTVHDEPASSDTHTEGSSQDDRSSEGVSNRTLRGEPDQPIPAHLIAPKPANFRFRSMMPPKPSVPGRIPGPSNHAVPKPHIPLRVQAGHAVHGPVSQGGNSERTVREKPMSPAPPPEMAMNHKPRGSPLPIPRASPVHLRRPHGPLARKNEPDHSKRRSIAAARAGEYFIHSLRDYPEEAKRGPAWK